MSQARYLEFYSPYLDLKSIKENGFTECHCPFHIDSNSSAGVNLETGIFNCFSCSRKYSPTKFYAELNGITQQEARCFVENYLIENNLYSHEDNFIKAPPGRNFKFDKLLSTFTDIDGIEIALEYAEGRGISIELMKELGIKYARANQTHWNRNSLVFPYYLNGNCVGIRYRDEEGNKSGEPGCHFTLWGLDGIKDEDRIVLVTEGESDRIRLFQELEGNYTVISTPGAVFKKEWEREFSGINKIILLPHADDAGNKHIKAAKEVLGDKLTVYNLRWKRGQLGKDLCDWLVYNDSKELVRDINGLANTSKKASIMTGAEFKEVANKPRRFFIDKLFTRGQVCIIAGPPKNKKTLFTLDMIRVMLTKGECFLERPDLPSLVDDPKVLFIEEEGDIEELYERAERVFSGSKWEENIFWGHRVGLKIDTDEGTQEIINFIFKNKIDLLVLDPFSKMFALEEDSSTDIGIVWSNIDRILSTCEDIGIIILHHFTKNGTINDMWNALRGSSRIAASADLGIFIQNRESKEPNGVKFRLDGRTLKDIKAKDGGDIFKTVYNEITGRFKIDEGIVILDKSAKFIEATKSNGPWTLEEAKKYLNISVPTLKEWCKKHKDKLDLDDKGMVTAL